MYKLKLMNEYEFMKIFGCLEVLLALHQGMTPPNPLHPNIGIHIHPTVLYTFPKVLFRRICLTFKNFLSW